MHAICCVPGANISGILSRIPKPYRTINLEMDGYALYTSEGYSKCLQEMMGCKTGQDCLENLNRIKNKDLLIRSMILNYIYDNEQKLGLNPVFIMHIPDKICLNILKKIPIDCRFLALYDSTVTVTYKDDKAHMWNDIKEKAPELQRGWETIRYSSEYFIQTHVFAEAAVS